MKKKLTKFIIVLYIGISINAQTVWNGPNITFTKPNFADYMSEVNQDRITDNVWITRADTKGIFNIKRETSYTGSDTSGNSPLDTEWAFGTTNNLGSLTFSTWAIAFGMSPLNILNKEMVVHLMTDEIYINIKFLSWSTATTGAGFSYERSTDSGLALDENEFKKFNLKLYPNPAYTSVALQAPMQLNNASITIFDAFGKKIFSEALYKGPIDISKLSNGLYLVKVASENQSISNRFIKN